MVFFFGALNLPKRPSTETLATEQSLGFLMGPRLMDSLRVTLRPQPFTCHQ